MSQQDPEHKDIYDPGYGAADFRAQLAGGRLRWLGSVLAVASAGLFVYLLTEGEKAELDFPFHLKGRAALWAVGFAFVVWAVVAITNWKAWSRKKNDARRARRF